MVIGLFALSRKHFAAAPDGPRRAQEALRALGGRMAACVLLFAVVFSQGAMHHSHWLFAGLPAAAYVAALGIQHAREHRRWAWVGLVCAAGLGLGLAVAEPLRDLSRLPEYARWLAPALGVGLAALPLVRSPSRARHAAIGLALAGAALFSWAERDLSLRLPSARAYTVIAAIIRADPEHHSVVCYGLEPGGLKLHGVDRVVGPTPPAPGLDPIEAADGWVVVACQASQQRPLLDLARRHVDSPRYIHTGLTGVALFGPRRQL